MCAVAVAVLGTGRRSRAAIRTACSLGRLGRSSHHWSSEVMSLCRFYGGVGLFLCVFLALVCQVQMGISKQTAADLPHLGVHHHEVLGRLTAISQVISRLPYLSWGLEENVCTDAYIKPPLLISTEEQLRLGWSVPHTNLHR